MNCQLPDCTNEIIATGKRGPKPRFCSAKCKQKNYRQSKIAQPVTRRSRSGQKSGAGALGPKPKTAQPVTEIIKPELKSPTQIMLEDFIREDKLGMERYRNVPGCEFLFKMYSTLLRQTKVNLAELVNGK